MWGGVTRSTLTKEQFSNIFKKYKRGTLHSVRERIIATESPSAFPRPWSFFRHIEGVTKQGHKLRNFDCALLLKWTRDVLNHQVHREEKLQSLQLGIEMFDGMLKRHTVGELAFCQFFALCESAADLTTAVERFKFVLDRYEIDFESKNEENNGGAGSSSVASGRKNADGVPEFSFLQNCNSYAWLLRIAHSAFAHHQSFDTVLLEESVSSIVQIVIPGKILREIQESEELEGRTTSSSSSSNTAMMSSSSPLSKLKKRKQMKFGRNSIDETGKNRHRQDHHLLSALIAPHDSTAIHPTSSSSSDNYNNSSLLQTTIPFTIAALLHLLRPYFRTDRKLQKLVDDYINPALIAQDEYELKSQTVIEISLATNHISFIKKSLMSKLAMMNNHHSADNSRVENDNMNIRATKYLLRKFTLHEKDFLFSSSELTDGPRGSSRLLIVGGGDNWENDQPEFDRSEIVGLFSSAESSANANDHQRAVLNNNNNNSVATFSENHSAVTLNPVHLSNIARRPYNFTWSFNHPYPLANSIAPAGRLLDIFETLFSSVLKNTSNSNNTSSPSIGTSLHKLALMISYIPKHFSHRLEIQSLRKEVPTAASDSHHMLLGGCCSEDPSYPHLIETEKLATTLINHTLTSSSSTPELLHYLLCAICRTSPGSAVEAVCKMLLSSSSSLSNEENQEEGDRNNHNLLLLLPLDPTLASITCALLKDLSKSSTSLNSIDDNDNTTLRLAASFMAQSSLVRCKRLEAYRDAQINGECPAQLRALWRKRHFDHVFETNSMSEVQFLTFVGNEVGPELLTKVFRISQQMVEETKQKMVDSHAHAMMMRLEKKKWIEEEKERIRQEQMDKGISAPVMPDWLVHEEIELEKKGADELRNDDIAFITDKSPIVTAFAESKLNIKSKSSINDRSQEEDNENSSIINITKAPLDSLILNYPSLRQALQLTLLRSCATSSDVDEREAALSFAPSNCPLFDLACIGNITGFNRFAQSRPSWSSLKDVSETLLQQQGIKNNKISKKKFIILDTSFIEHSERFLALKSEDPSIAEIFVPHCVLSSLDATATCPELTPIDLESLTTAKEVTRTAMARLMQVSSGAANGMLEVIQFSEQLLAAAMTRKTESNTNDAPEILATERIRNLILNSHNDDLKSQTRANDQINHLEMIESQIKEWKRSPYTLINDTNSILVDLAKLFSLAATSTSSTNEEKESDKNIDVEIVIATNDIQLVERIEAINNQEGFAIRVMTSVPLEILKNPDNIENLENKKITESVLQHLQESVENVDEDEDVNDQVHNNNNNIDGDIIPIEEKKRRLDILRQAIEERKNKLSSSGGTKRKIRDNNNTRTDDVEESSHLGSWQQIVASDDDEADDHDELESGTSVVSATHDDADVVQSSSSSSETATVPDDWKAKNAHDERFPPFELPGGKAAFRTVFKGRPGKDELPLERGLADELENPDDGKKITPYDHFQGIVETRKKFATPFRPGKALMDEAHQYAPAHGLEVTRTANQLSRRAHASVPNRMTYSRYQANINDPRNKELVETYKREREIHIRQNNKK